ncbi:hypothetical protein VPHK460_0155 [Vibrio phage K460]
MIVVLNYPKMWITLPCLTYLIPYLWITYVYKLSYTYNR